MLIAEVALFFQRAVDDALKFLWQIGIQPHWRNRRFAEDGLENHSRSVPSEWHHSGGHLIKHCAEGKYIRTAIQIFSSRLLGRHVSNRAQRSSRTGQVHRIHRRRKRSSLLSELGFECDLG